VTYLYAVLDASPSGSQAPGAFGEPLASITVGPLVAVVGLTDTAPQRSIDALSAQDAVVRRLAARATAALPARFGTLLSEAALRERLAAAEAELAAALTLVAGCEQMTVHLFGPRQTPALGPGDAEPPDRETPRGPGTRYLHERRAAWRRARAVPEAAALRRRVADLVRAEQAERRPPRDRHEPREITDVADSLVASVHHLVPRARVDEYRALVCRGGDDMGPWRPVITGPWPVYAFAPGAVA
jgi:hypothetical protein